MKFENLTHEQFATFSNLLALKGTALRLWQEGVPSTQTCRILHNDYQILFNDDLESPDDFYNLSHPGNKRMVALMLLLGFEHTNYGFALIPGQHDVNQLNFK